MQVEPHSAKPAAQVILQTPASHVGLPLNGTGQAFPQAPQC
jgi:hypothetical protein